MEGTDNEIVVDGRIDDRCLGGKEKEIDGDCFSNTTYIQSQWEEE